jgi:hypothetical protein
MRSKPVFALMAAAAIGLMLIAGRCSERNDGAATRVETADNAAAGVKSQPTEFSLSAEDDEGFDFPEREEIRQKRKLTPGTKVFIIGLNDARVNSDGKEVFVIGVNGKVKVETADTDTAEVLVVRSVRKREYLQRQKVEISNDKDLFIRIGGGDEPDPVPEIRQRVVLRLPRKAGLEIREIGGDITVDGIFGYLEIAEVTGNVRATRVAGPIVVGGAVNGGVDITFAPLTDTSIKICCDINGDVDLRFEGEVDADLYTWSVNGAIKPDLPNVEIRESGWGTLKARKRIGNGGSVIEVHDVNGNVTLSKAVNRDRGTEGRRDRGTERLRDGKAN